MSENAICYEINGRYEYKELVVYVNFDYDQRARIALELLKELVKSEKSTRSPESLAKFAFELEESFHKIAKERNMLIPLPVVPKKKD